MNGCGKDGGVVQWVVRGPGLGSQYPRKELLVLACNRKPSTEEEVEKGRFPQDLLASLSCTHTHACVHTCTIVFTVVRDIVGGYQETERVPSFQPSPRLQVGDPIQIPGDPTR